MLTRFFRIAQRAARRAAAGFTLVEMLVAMVLVSLIMIVALDAFNGTRRVSRKNLSVTEAQQAQGSYAMQEMAVTLRRTGFQLGPTFAILRSYGVGAVMYTSTWDQYPGGPAGTWIWQEPLGNTSDNNPTPNGYIPVAGTDGISVKYGEDQPPIHVCIMPNGNANNMDMNYDPAYKAFYPRTGDVIDVITTSNCYADGDQGTNTVTVGIAKDSYSTAPDQCSNAGGAGVDCTKGNQGDTCYCKDTLCKSLQLTKNCYKVTFDHNVGKPGCDFCEKGPTYIVTSRTASFWISTEDRTGVIYNTATGAVKSRPVLVGRYGGPSAAAPVSTPARIIATDIEDLQLAFILNNPVGTFQESQVVPVNNLLPKTRALRVSLSARTGVTDLMYRNYAYCTGRGASFGSLFSRSTLENHPASTVVNTDYCDGLRRVVYNQVVNLPNMTSYPIGKAPTI